MEIKHGDYVWVQVTRDKERLGKVKWIKDLMTGTFYFIEFDNEVNSGAYYESHSVRLARKENDPPNNELCLTPEKSDLRPVSAIKGGTKHDTGKNRLELIPASAIDAMGRAFTFGAGKYTDHNWSKGFDWDRLVGAAMRHLNAWRAGQDKDPESGLSHLDHALACLAMLSAHEQEGLGNDNRRKVKRD